MINRTLALLAGLLLLPIVLLGSCSFAPYRVAGTPSSDASGTNAVYLVSHGWHTGLIVPAAPLHQALPALQTRFGDAAYYEIGWGDKGLKQLPQNPPKPLQSLSFWRSYKAQATVHLSIATSKTLISRQKTCRIASYPS